MNTFATWPLVIELRNNPLCGPVPRHFHKWNSPRSSICICAAAVTWGKEHNWVFSGNQCRMNNQYYRPLLIISHFSIYPNILAHNFSGLFSNFRFVISKRYYIQLLCVWIVFFWIWPFLKMEFPPFNSHFMRLICPSFSLNFFVVKKSIWDNCFVKWPWKFFRSQTFSWIFFF